MLKSDRYIPAQVRTRSGNIVYIWGGNGNLAQTRIAPNFAENLRDHTISDDWTFMFLGRRRPSEWVEEMCEVSVGADGSSVLVPMFANEEEAFRDYLTRVIRNRNLDLSGEQLKAFIDRCGYLQIDARNPEDYFRLRDSERDLGRPEGAQSLHYCALMPADYPAVIRGLNGAKLYDKTVKLILEKPMALTLSEAQQLRNMAQELFLTFGGEMYSVDHYLLKDGAKKNGLFRRSTDGILAGAWNAKRIKWIELSCWERLGAEGREHFFRTGNIADFVVNHGLEVLSLIGMDPPSSWNPRAIAEKRLEFLQSLRVIEPDRAVYGQYGPGSEVDGYQVEISRWEQLNPARPKLPRDKPTYFAMLLQSDLERWTNGRSPTTFALRHQRRAPAKAMRMVATFRRPENGCANDGCGRKIDRTQIVAQLDPPPFGFMQYTQVLAPGSEVRFVTEEIQTCGHIGTNGQPEASEDAYKLLLKDLLHGNFSWFPTVDEVIACLKLMDPFLANGPIGPIHQYPPGSFGPLEANELFGAWSTAPIRS